MKKNICILFMFLAVYLSAFSNNQWEDAISQINEKSLPLVNIDVDVSSLTKANYINGKITIYDYENSELSWEEIAKKYEIPKAVLQYHRRKETENAEEN